MTHSSSNWITNLNKLFEDLAKVGIHNSKDLADRWEAIRKEQEVNKCKEIKQGVCYTTRLLDNTPGGLTPLSTYHFLLF